MLMKKPLSFIIEKNGKLELNQEVMDIIKESDNPKFISFYGKTRLGKSTTLNQLIRGNNQTWKFINKKPFGTNDTLDSVTKGCNIFGPIKISEILKRHEGLQNKKLKEDYDVFFCDTEGISSLDGIQKQTIPGILTLLQICTISVYMVNRNCSANDLKEICSQIQISRIIDKKIISPKVTIYISNIFSGKKEDNENEDDGDDNKNEEEEEEDIILNNYKESANVEKQRIYEAVNKKYPQLKMTINDFEVIPGGPYQEIKNEPDHNDINVKLYWNSIQEIISVFLKNKVKKLKGEEIIKFIQLLFEAFCGLEEFNEDYNLEEYLKTYLDKSFDNYTNNQFKLKVEKIKEDIKTNFISYINILNDDEKAKQSLDECFNKDMIEIYKRIIHTKVKNFINLSIEKYRKYIKEQIDKEFTSISEEIISDKNINSLIEEIKINIKNAEYKEDINMNLVNNTEKLWNDMYEKNKIILNYFKNKKANLLDNLKENFISKIKTIFRNLISKKVLWTDYLKEKLILSQKEINNLYQIMFSKCNYHEDMEKYIKKSDILFNEIFPEYKEKYFKNTSQQRLNEVIEKIKNICKEEYIKILKNKLPQFNNIKSDITSKVKDIIESYLFKIFNKVEFRDKVDQSLGTKNAFLSNIPLDIKENPEIKEDKKKEIDKIIDDEIEKGIISFNEKRNNLPLFNEVIGNILKQCTKAVDDRIKELINKFHYLEEKIIFNSDTIFSFLTNNQDIYKNSYSKINEINNNIKSLCNQKANEYDLLVKNKKPEWNKIKNEKIIKINHVCNDYIQKTFKNAHFQDNIKNVNVDQLKNLIMNIPDLYEGVEHYKREEINSEIDKIIQNTKEKINYKKNSLQNWDMIKTQIIQQAEIEMNSKSKSNLGSTDLNKVKNILINHIENNPSFFDDCKTEERKNEIRKEIKEKAIIIAQEYINKKKEQDEKDRKNKEEKQKIMNMYEESMRQKNQFENQAKEEKRKTQEEIKKREEIERMRVEEEKRRHQAELEKQNIEREIQRRDEEWRKELQRIQDQQRQQQQHDASEAEIEDLANRALNGEFGNGQERRNRLGHLYNRVQNRVNEKLGLSYRH